MVADPVVIGSQAVREILRRPPQDLDLLAPYSMLPAIRAAVGARSALPQDDTHYVLGTDQAPVEVEIAWPGSTGEELLTLMAEHRDLTCATCDDRWASAAPGVVLALKLSHRFRRSPHFLKTRRDILALRAAGVVVPEPLTAWLRRRQKETLAYHAHPKLNQDSKGFFGPEVPYVYVHDTIHLAMAIDQHPAYLRFQQDGAEVKVDRAKWEALGEFWKLRSVLEECYVLALERHQIPNNFTPDPMVSFRIALEKVCTTIASGWWREWAWEHYDEALAAADMGYVDLCRGGIASGLIQRVL